MAAPIDPGSMTLRDYLRPLFRQFWVVLLAFSVVMITVVIAVEMKTPIYKAETTMLISAEKAVEGPFFRQFAGSGPQGKVLTQSRLVKSNPVLERTVMALGLDERPLDDEKHFASKLKAPFIENQAEETRQRLAQLDPDERAQTRFRMAVERLRNSIEVSPIRDTDLFKVAVYDYNPQGTKVMANTLSRAYVIYDLEQKLADLALKYGPKHASIQQLRDTIARRIENLNGDTLTNIEAIGPASVKVVEQAALPLGAEGRPAKFYYLVALVIGTVFSIFMAYAVDHFDQSIKSRRDVENNLKMGFFGSVPKGRLFSDKLMAKITGRSAYKRAFSALADQLIVNLEKQQKQSLLLFGPTRSEGVTTVTFNLGRAVAERSDNKVLMIDANFNDPGLHKALKQKNEAGLTEVLKGKLQPEQAIQKVDERLHLLPAGNRIASGVSLMQSGDIKALLERLKADYDLILIDCADSKTSQENLVLAEAVDQVAYVIREGKTRRHVIRAVTPSADWAKDKFMGVILNGRTYAIPRFIYDLI